MTKISLLAAPAATLLVLAACASSGVRTGTAPDAPYFSGLRTFDLMKQPAAPAEGSNDPMLVGSAANGVLRAGLVKAFEDRGYVRSQNPDFLVAYYAAGSDGLDVTRWNYGYPFRPRWWGPGPDWGTETQIATRYPKGTVLVDVIDPKTREVLWRGERVGNAVRDDRDLSKTIAAVLQKLPTAAESMRTTGPLGG